MVKLLFTGRNKFLNLFLNVLIQFTSQKEILHDVSKLAMRSGAKPLIVINGICSAVFRCSKNPEFQESFAIED